MSLLIRQIRGHDVPQISEWREDPEKAEYFRRWPPSFILPTEKCLDGYFALDSKESGALVGVVNIAAYDHTSRSCQFGLLLTDEARSKKHIYEAVHFVAQYAFEHLNYNKITCLTLTHREPLHKAMESCFFKKEAVIPQNIFYKGKFHDEVMHSLYARDYFEHHKEKR